jgi:hypothetical protein
VCLLITQDVADLEAVPLCPVVVRLGAIGRHRPSPLVADLKHRRRKRQHRCYKEGAGDGEVEDDRHRHADAAPPRDRTKACGRVNGVWMYLEEVGE